MRIQRFQVINYKSFADSGEMRLEPSFNVIVGRNNVGKTALAEAMSLRFPSKPHRSMNTLPTPDTPISQDSRTEISIRLEANELVELLIREMPTFYVPTEAQEAPAGRATFRTVLSEGVTVNATFLNGSYHSAKLSTYTGETPPRRYMRFTMDRSGNPSATGPLLDMASDYPELAAGVAAKFHERLYNFSAVRFGIDEKPIGTNRFLAPDASDLVQVLDLLSRNTSRWQRYFGLVRTVLPEIEAITFMPSGQSSGHVRASLWNIDPDTEREDLAVPLSESGTGVGQVLAIPYVVFTSEYPRTIVIDEPQSFLHPGAVRKLFEILKGYPQHQYVITTHSPNAVTAADPRALFLVRKEGEECVVDQLDVSMARDQTRFLREVGASLSDVFGADNVLWVEGATEEECFPLILSKVAERQLLGTKIVGVLSTDDLGGRRSRDAYRIYKSLSEAGGLLPPAVGFIFDREGRDDELRKDLDRESRGLVTFTPRRMYENYLLNPHAIAVVTSKIKGFRTDGEISSEEVERWMGEQGSDAKYFGKTAEPPARTDPSWLTDVHGTRLLEDLFFDLSEARVTYEKVAHGVELTRWLCDNARDDLEDLAGLMVERLEQHERSTKESDA